MFLAKLFGMGRSDAQSQDLADDEPTHIPGLSPVRIGAPRASDGSSSLPVPTAQRSTVRQSPLLGRAPGASGFDPYNSGAFNRAQAWERTSKR